ncbi:MAG: dehydrogenase [Blastopirellula sp.]|nr:MAG: dehydrogenase [Blastopirellula sp.]
MSQINRRNFIQQTTMATVAATTASLASTSFAAETLRIKAAQIGTKHAHASGKIATLRKLSDLYEVVGIVEPDDAQWERVKNQAAYKDLIRLSEEELLSDKSVQVIAVETEVSKLVPTAMRCIQNNKHIHLDKPAGESMSDYRTLRKGSDERGLTVQLGYMLRYNPAFQFMFNAVKEGWLGTITEVSAMMGKMASPGLRKDLAQYPGGGMFELACHIIDAVVFALGKPDSVSTFSSNVIIDGTEFKDNQLAVLQYEKALATVRCNHVDPLGFSRRSFSIIGDQGMIAINPLEPPKLQMTLTKSIAGYSKGSHTIELPKTEGRYDGEFKDLAEIVRGNKKLAWNSAHDLAAHETILRSCGLPVD